MVDGVDTEESGGSFQAWITSSSLVVGSTLPRVGLLYVCMYCDNFVSKVMLVQQDLLRKRDSTVPTVSRLM